MSALVNNLALVSQPVSLPSSTSYLDIFTSLCNQDWCFWLDSSESDHLDSHLDIIVWQPAITIQSNENTTKVVALNKGFSHLSGHYQKDPFDVLKTIQKQIFSTIELPETLQKFNCGTVGYFSYDLGRKVEKLPSIAQNDIELPLMAAGIYLQALIFDRKTKQLTLIAPQNQWHQIETQLKDSAQTDSTNFTLTSDWQANMSQESYNQKFAKVQDYLLTGDCYQINLAQRFTASYQGCELDAYLTLRKENKAPFSAFMRFNDHCVLSISPERFLKLHHDKVQTKPIKGTLPRGVNKAEDESNAEKLRHSTKDKAENLMIVDLLRNDISKVCEPGSVKVPKLFEIESFPAVHHLVSTVEGKLKKQYEATDLLRAAFPGGSITGAPKIRAMEIIEELEPHRRNLYCGSIGYISACGNMDTSITIRTLICKNGKIHCWAGGGLVADSKADSEYQETFDKVAKILPVLTKKQKG